MQVKRTVTLSEKQLEEALIQYINKKNPSLEVKEIKKINYFNGEVEEKALFTKLEAEI